MNEDDVLCWGCIVAIVILCCVLFYAVYSSIIMVLS